MIGKGSPNRAGTAKVHGEALGDEEIANTRASIGWNHPPFEVPAEVYEAWDHRAEGERIENEWKAMFAGYEAQYPELAAELKRRLAGDLPADWSDVVMNAICQAAEAAETVPQGEPEGAERPRARAPRTPGRLRRPHGFEPHQLDGRQEPQHG